jgi:carbonic anhydrase
MKPTYDQLLNNNRAWAAECLACDAHVFANLAQGQSPKYLIIGCSDSRVSPTEVTKTGAGEIFVHRNIANLFVHTDMSAQSVLQYAVEVLKVEHVIVMGHYECGGVKAAMGHHSYTLANPWIRNIRDVYRLYRRVLSQIESEDERFRRLVEFNVREQVFNLYKTATIQRAWASEHRPEIHGWVYDISTGLIKDLRISRDDWSDVEDIYRLDFDDLHLSH